MTHEPKIRRGLRTQASTRLADVGYDPADHDGTPANPLTSHTLEPDIQIIMNNQPVFLAQSERIHEGEPTGDWLPVLDTTSGSPIVVVARDLREARSVLAGLVSAGRVENPWRAGIMDLVHVTVARSR